MLKAKQRTIATDMIWDEDVTEQDFSDHIFVRVAAKGRKFTKVRFQYSTFDGCYLRNCTFDSCDFTGCKFVGMSFSGSGFSGCKFDYASFERTVVDNDILETSAPAYENLKSRFARSLRMNYQGLGDADSANRAILLELEATRVHLHKAWSSNESYYRKKYHGSKRVAAFFSWLRFTILDWVWGNGENPIRLARCVAVLLLAMSLGDVMYLRDPAMVSSYGQALLDAPQVLLGTRTPGYPGLLLAAITLARLTLFGLFMSILIRRFARR